MKSRKANISSMKKSPHVPLRQIAEEKRRGKELGVVDTMCHFFISFLKGKKKKAKAEGKTCHATTTVNKLILLLLYVKSRKTDLSSMKKSPHVPFRQITEEKRRGKELRVV